MSFFRILLALLISGGIAYGLYHMVEQQKAERLAQTEVVAERAEIAEAPEVEQAAETEQEPASEPDADVQAEVAPTPAEESSFTERTVDAVEQVEEAEPTGDGTTTSSLSLLPRPPEAPQMAELPEMPATDDNAGEGTAAENETVATEMPAASIEANTSDSVAALEIVSGGMAYSKARETLIDAGWTPRTVDTREGTPNDTEATLIEAGFTELKGCSDAERAICRFEFVDGEKRIAAILTAGSDGDPSVIDAFLMDIARTE